MGAGVKKQAYHVIGMKVESVGEAQTENVVYHLKVSITFYYLFKRYVNKYNILCDQQAKNHRHCGLLISGTPSVFPVFDRIINKKYIICWPETCYFISIITTDLSKLQQITIPITLLLC